ncbi:gem-associated protein 8 isoform X2 [Canis lupus dingo]|nr:gem-associated protein 8 isoform X2 [Canis lupus dingo]XP_048963420.1 gem-associated protein 8 isoform X2 [Canis lupus dingo]
MAWMQSHHGAYRKAIESYFSCPWPFPPAALPGSSYPNQAKSPRPSRDHLLASTDSHCGSSHSRRSRQHPPARKTKHAEEEAGSESDGGVECDLSNMVITEELRQYFAQTERHREERPLGHSMSQGHLCCLPGVRPSGTWGAGLRLCSLIYTPALRAYSTPFTDSAGDPAEGSFTYSRTAAAAGRPAPERLRERRPRPVLQQPPLGGPPDREARRAPPGRDEAPVWGQRCQDPGHGGRRAAEFRQALRQEAAQVLACHSAQVLSPGRRVPSQHPLPFGFTKSLLLCIFSGKFLLY